MSEIDKENLINRLDRHLDWIKSCDTKASIVLAIIGVFLTIFLSDQSLNMLKEIFKQIVNNINFSNILYLIFFVFSWCLFIYGSNCLVKVLIPRDKKILEEEGLYKDSLYYFETISNNSFLEFKRKVTRDKDNEISDLLSQIYVNAKICAIKYQFFKKGIKYSFFGIVSIVLVFMIGALLVNIGGFN
ncbi:hypothetical protein FDF40_03645 [Clostridium sporogenes]|uniref:hypothetical protein n=1 Tax=Bacillota TaxID=1239 RepID=UPI0011BF0243|nr:MULTISPECIES: hypothetical protein [Bacillota]NFT30570.1 hypothetical protein [Clostridium sporogenes]GIN25552.1 hypothetical protein J31TS2_21320 [Bacillus licheniformis]GIN29709.1 hypothetical protein J2TS5_17480 [Bacillus licheniformis]